MFIAPKRILLLLLLLLPAPNSLLAQSSLAESLSQDDALQDAAIIAVRSALGARKQTAVVRRSTFIVEIGMYIATYRGTHNSRTLENIQNRYAAARAELLEPRLPATMEELVSILEML
ncbi:MAG: hypothetical protein COB20_07750 [SAR86 cluster bacterium]|uniref:Uncharacterized protein n=1 Tax=SAR86 cluster bacterium TaxID=2030880 RepID=A0A2A4X4N5_9GAMM|nr:MAG: hypothetical protein COB20_07750 [SAR86 cluster bacterium]